MRKNDRENLGDVLNRIQSNVASTSMPVSTSTAWNCAPDCQECGGYGLVRFDVPVDHKFFGQLFRCKNLPLDSSKLILTGLSPVERRWTWDKVLPLDNSVTEAVNAVKIVLDRGYGIVYLWGDTGLAKTLILKIAVAEYIRTNPHYWATYTLMPHIVDELRSVYDGNENPTQLLKQLEDDYSRFPLLAIDEIGVERETGFSAERQFLLIDRRYTAAIENRENVITLLASNLLPNELPTRIRSRLFDGRCNAIQMMGDDFRLGATWADSE
jgi:hypothetical protein